MIILFGLQYINSKMSQSGVCSGVTSKGEKCRIKTREKYCRHHKPDEKVDVEMDECCVCTDPIPSKELLSCGHNIHMTCVVKSGKDTCPICRSKVNMSREDRREMNEYHKKYQRSNMVEETNRLRISSGYSNILQFLLNHPPPPNFYPHFRNSSNSPILISPIGIIYIE